MVHVRKTVAVAACVTALTAFGSTAAFAGERSGTGDAIEVVAVSDCAYSGLEDFDFSADVDPGVTQNWGQIPFEDRLYLTSIGVSPGVLCNGYLNPIN